MRLKLRREFLSRSLCLAAVVIAWSCGGAAEKEDEFPDVKGTYGGLGGGSGLSDQRWVATDGSVATRLCNLKVGITEQSGATFTGYIQRVPVNNNPPDNCTSQGTIAGEVAKDRTIRFQLTQARWSTCTAVGTAEYAGTIVSGDLNANGSVALQCDDGAAITVRDHLTAALPHLPGL